VERLNLLQLKNYQLHFFTPPAHIRDMLDAINGAM